MADQATRRHLVDILSDMIVPVSAKDIKARVEINKSESTITWDEIQKRVQKMWAWRQKQ